jgi:hypothetical protein
MIICTICQDRLGTNSGKRTQQRNAQPPCSSRSSSGGTALIKDWKDLLTGVGDNQSLLLSLKESQYFKHFADQAKVRLSSREGERERRGGGGGRAG